MVAPSDFWQALSMLHRAGQVTLVSRCVSGSHAESRMRWTVRLVHPTGMVEVDCPTLTMALDEAVCLALARGWIEA